MTSESSASSRRRQSPPNGSGARFASRLKRASSVGEPSIGGPLEHLQRERGGPERAVDKEHLLLGADAAHAGLDAILPEEALERLHVVEQRPHERVVLLSLACSETCCSPMVTAPPFARPRSREAYDGERQGAGDPRRDGGRLARRGGAAGEGGRRGQKLRPAASRRVATLSSARPNPSGASIATSRPARA